MGIITLALIANGSLGAGADPPFWVIASAAAAIALGTYSGGWRIIKTTGTRIIKMDAAQGFSSQGAGAAVILASTHFGFPLSTTHVINGGMMGAGAAKRLSAVRWGVAGNIVIAWVLTLPAAAAIGALAYGVTRIFGTGALGPVVVTLASLSLIVAALRAPGRARRPGRGLERMIATLVEGKELLETVVASAVAGIGVTFVFSVAIWGVARFADLSRNERPLAAGARGRWSARLALLATAAAVVFGIVVMTSKLAAAVHWDPCAPPATSRSSWSWRSASPSLPAGGNVVDAIFTAIDDGLPGRDRLDALRRSAARTS